MLQAKMDIFISGSYTTSFGELWNHDLRSLGLEAALGALQDAKMQPEEIDALYVGNMLASRFSGQDHLGALFASELGLTVPAQRLEAACASGGVALRQAYLQLKANEAKNVLVLGVEKMTDVPTPMASAGLAGASDEEWEAYYGATFPSLYAMLAREHMRAYGTTREQLALCSVKNHANGSLNPKAQFQRPITIEQVLHAAPVADPLGLLDCSPITDGAAALILSCEKLSPVKLLSCQQAQDQLALHQRASLTELAATKEAARAAFAQAQLHPQDIHFAEVHDCFTIAEILAIEDLGFVEKGSAGAFIQAGETKRDGGIPINPSGGLKAVGHPVGATGVKQVAEIYDQFLGRAGERQLPEEKLHHALTHNVGGSGATAVVSIFEKV